MVFGLYIAFLVILLDQLSKWWMKDVLLSENMVIILAPFFNLVRAWNTGVSFSMFNNWGNWGVVVLSLIAVLVVAYLLWWLKSEQSKSLQIALGFIIGGAIGNVIDRVRFGAVFDFLDFHIADKHWPAFNLADSFICIGAVIIIVSSLCVKEKEVVKK